MTGNSLGKRLKDMTYPYLSGTIVSFHFIIYLTGCKLWYRLIRQISFCQLTTVSLQFFTKSPGSIQSGSFGCSDFQLKIHKQINIFTQCFLFDTSKGIILIIDIFEHRILLSKNCQSQAKENYCQSTSYHNYYLRKEQCNNGETSFILPQHQTDDAFSLNEKYPGKYLLLPGYFYINCLYFIRDDCNSEPRL